jgi:hypothetical protein
VSPSNSNLVGASSIADAGVPQRRQTAAEDASAAPQALQDGTRGF